MKYVLMFVDRVDVDAATSKGIDEQIYQQIYGWFERNYQAGLIANGGAELQPVSTATTVRSAERGNDKPIVVDGPFAETKEVVGGFTVVDVADLDAAIELARTWPPLQVPGHAVEIRPIVEHGA